LRLQSPGDDFARRSRLTGVLKFFQGGFESFAHRRNCIRLKRSRLYEWRRHHCVPSATHGIIAELFNNFWRQKGFMPINAVVEAKSSLVHRPHIATNIVF